MASTVSMTIIIIVNHDEFSYQCRNLACSKWLINTPSKLSNTACRKMHNTANKYKVINKIPIQNV